MSEVWAAMRRIQRSHKTEERPMTERLGPQESWPWGLQGSKPSAWVFFFIWKIRQKNSLYFPGLSWKQKDIMCTQPLVQNAHHHSQQEEAAKILTLGQFEIQNFCDFSKLRSQIQDDKTIQDIDFFLLLRGSLQRWETSPHPYPAAVLPQSQALHPSHPRLTPPFSLS